MPVLGSYKNKECCSEAELGTFTFYLICPLGATLSHVEWHFREKMTDFLRLFLADPDPAVLSFSTVFVQSH
jgi:hypothetical protein